MFWPGCHSIHEGSFQTAFVSLFASAPNLMHWAKSSIPRDDDPPFLVFLRKSLSSKKISITELFPLDVSPPTTISDIIELFIPVIFKFSPKDENMASFFHINDANSISSALSQHNSEAKDFDYILFSNTFAEDFTVQLFYGGRITELDFLFLCFLPDYHFLRTE